MVFTLQITKLLQFRNFAKCFLYFSGSIWMKSCPKSQCAVVAKLDLTGMRRSYTDHVVNFFFCTPPKLPETSSSSSVMSPSLPMWFVYTAWLVDVIAQLVLPKLLVPQCTPPICNVWIRICIGKPDMTYANDLFLVSVERSLYVYKHLLATLTLWLHIMIVVS